VALIALAGVLFVPIEPLVFLAVVAMGPWRGGGLALLGAAGAVTAGYLAGRALGPARLTPWIGRSGRRVWRRLGARGAMTVAVLRALPVAPATAIHLLCGAARVPAREYALGTLLGALPLLLALIGLASLLRLAIRNPGPKLVTATVATAVVLAFFARRVRTSLLARRLSHGQPRERDDLG
jgi:phospholipase D1/2